MILLNAFLLLLPLAVTTQTYEGPSIGPANPNSRPYVPGAMSYTPASARGYADKSRQILERQYIRLTGNRDWAATRYSSINEYSRVFRAAAPGSALQKTRLTDMQNKLRSLSAGRLLMITHRARVFRSGANDTFGEYSALRQSDHFGSMVDAAELLDRSYSRNYGAPYFAGPGDSGRDLVVKALNTFSLSGEVGASLGLQGNIGIGVSPGTALDTVLGIKERIKEGVNAFSYSKLVNDDGSIDTYELHGAVSKARSEVDVTAKVILENPLLILELENYGIDSTNIDFSVESFIKIFEGMAQLTGKMDHVSTDISDQIQTLGVDLGAHIQNLSAGSADSFRVMGAKLKEIQDLIKENRQNEAELAFGKIVTSLDPRSAEGRELARVVAQAAIHAAEKSSQLETLTQDYLNNVRDIREDFASVEMGMEAAEVSTRLFSAVASVNKDWGNAARIASGLHASVQKFRTQELAGIKDAYLALKEAKFALDAVRGTQATAEAVKALQSAVTAATMKMVFASINMVSAAFEIANLVMGLFGGSGPDPVLEMLKDIKQDLKEFRSETKRNFAEVQEKLSEILSEIRKLQRDVQAMSMRLEDIDEKVRGLYSKMDEQATDNLYANVKLSEACLNRFPLLAARAWPSREIDRLTNSQRSEYDQSLNRFAAKSEVTACIQKLEETAIQVLGREGLPHTLETERIRTDLRRHAALIRNQKLEFLCYSAGHSSETCDKVGVGQFDANFASDDNLLAGIDFIRSHAETYARSYSEATDGIFLWIRNKACEIGQSQNSVAHLNSILQAIDLTYMPVIERETCPIAGDPGLNLGIEARLVTDTVQYLAYQIQMMDSTTELSDEHVDSIRQFIETQMMYLSAYRYNVAMGDLLSESRDTQNHPYLGNLFQTASMHIDLDMRLLQAVSKVGQPLYQILRNEAGEIPLFLSSWNSILKNQILNDNSESLVSRIRRGLAATEGIDTPTVLFYQVRRNRESLREALESYAFEEVFSHTLSLSVESSNSSKRNEARPNKTVVERMLGSPRSGDISSSIFSVFNLIYENDKLAEQNKFSDQGSDEYEEEQKRALKRFYEDERFNSDLILDQDYYRYALQDTNYSTGLLQYHQSVDNYSSPQTTFSFPLPISVSEKFGDGRSDDDVLKSAGYTARSLIFRRTDETLSALHASAPERAHRDLNYSSLIQVIEELEKDVRRFPYPEVPTGKPATPDNPSTTIKVGSAIPTNLLTYIRLIAFKSDFNLNDFENPYQDPRVLKAYGQSYCKEKAKEYDDLKRRAGIVLNTIRPEVILAQKRGQVVQEMLDAYMKWRKGVSDGRLEDKPSMAQMYNLFSQGLSGDFTRENYSGTNEALRDTPAGVRFEKKNSNDLNRDLYIRSDLGSGIIDSPSELFIVTVYGSEKTNENLKEGYSVPGSSSPSRGGNPPPPVVIPTFHYYGNFYFQYWAEEFERAFRFYSQDLADQFVETWTGLRKSNGRSEPNDPRTSDDMKREDEKAVKRALSEIQQRLKLDSLKAISNQLSDTGQRPIDRAIKRYQRSVEALSGWLQLVWVSSKGFDQTVKLNFETWTLEDLGIAQLAKEEERNKVKDFSKIDLRRLSTLDQKFIDQQEQALQAVELEVYGPTLMEGKLFRRRFAYDFSMIDLHPIIDYWKDASNTEVDEAKAQGWRTLKSMGEMGLIQEGAQ